MSRRKGQDVQERAAPGTPFATTLKNRLQQANNLLGHLTPWALPGLLLVPLGYTVWYIFRWPIVAFDGDLWSHLTSGRYILEQGALPTHSFYSFLEPPRPWLDYRWLFQVLVYAVHSGFGYGGLVWLKNLTYLGTLAVVLCFLLQVRRRRGMHVYLLASLFLILALFLIPRFQIVRPHMFTYLFLALFIHILEFHSDRAFLLPPLALLWCNLHGIVYPLIVMVSMAYLVEFSLLRFRGKKEAGRVSTLFLGSILLTICAIFATPHGVRLLAYSLTPIHYAARYIAEFRPLVWSALLERPISHPDFLLMGLLALTATGLGASIARRSVRISHLVLLAGGMVLLTGGNRFTYALALLALPVCTLHLPRFLRCPTRVGSVPAAAGLALILTLTAWMYIRQPFTYPTPRYPFSPRGLPDGVAAFLEQRGGGGRLLNTPNAGGYLAWRLYPRYRILVDMQVPHFFTDEDAFLGIQVFHDGAVLEKLVVEYDPEFMVVPIEVGSFEGLIRDFPEYVPVFFDDSAVLYLDAGQRPALAASHRLLAIQPFRMASQGVSAFLRDRDAGSRERVLHEALRILNTHPDGLLANQVAALIFHQKGDIGRVMARAEAIIEAHPESVSGYWLKGDALRTREEFEAALRFYRLALDRLSNEDTRVNLYLRMGQIYQQRGEHRKAYRMLSRALNPFGLETSSEALYSLGSAALLAGREAEAGMLFRLALYKARPGDAHYLQLLETQRRLHQETGGPSGR